MKPSSKRKRVSKNKKKNWRKHINIEDVENFLEEKRVEERTGGPISEKKDESLFFVDKTIKKTKKKGKAKEKVKKFKCYQFLENYSSVEPFIKPNQTKSHNEKKTSITSKKQLLREAKKLALPQAEKIKSDLNTPHYDLWGNKAEKEKSDYDLDIEQHKTQAINLKVPKLRYDKPSDLPSVEIPHPGASYNPAFDDYQELLKQAHEIELKKKKESDHLERVLTQKFPTKDQAPTKETWLKEMSRCLQIEGLNEDEKNNSSDEEKSNPDILPNPTVRAERKPRAKRRREQKQKILMKELQGKKLLKRQLNEIYRIKSIKSDIIKTEETIRKKIEMRKKKKLKKRTTPGKLSRQKYEAPDLEVCTSNELTKTLREIKTQGCLSEDRIKSFQRRNIIVPTMKQLRKLKYKRKRYLKKSHKE